MDILLLSTWFLSAVVILFGCLYYFITNRYKYWERLGIPFLKPQSYIYGNNDKLASGELSMFELYIDIYKQLEPYSYGGIFSFYTPVLVIRDPELIKLVLTKDFNHFVNRLPNMVKEYEPLTEHLFNIEDEKWRTLRNKLTTTFSSGKIKLMSNIIKEISIQLVETVNANEGIDVEMKDLLARYTTDVISSCAFGLNSNSLKNPESEFVQMCRKALETTPLRRVKDMLNSFVPRLVHMLRITTFDEDVTEFFHKIVRETIHYREENNVRKNDFMQLLMQMRHDFEGKSTNNEKLDFVTAQCFLIFLAGFETSSTALSFGLFELAMHPDIQEKVQQEIDDALEKHDGKVTYELLNEIPYTDQVIYETLRRYPALPFLFRTCSKTYKFPDNDLVLEKGSWVFIPTSGIHYDPKYYSHPEEFNPEHFTEKAKESRPNYTFLSFGDGPRNCIGARFGLIQIKMGYVQLLRNFTFAVSSKMELPMKFLKHNILTNSESGIWLNCKRRRADIDIS